ncbi:hypothetical protein PRIPAC_93981 [Pristionchus pacificus]|uniref:Uncharacterized protein n=1 Tax=Pristionchus pacificus TaxID=54126 RepID=A0A2A6BJB0_PRIPA|nr:hypothetical protein PRIPAC_93981 [Pristionchus pacificus]|eukprot:PDM65918.1 hypothetical protein PRIPAC_44197 [Pristionchus pacificus]
MPFGMKSTLDLPSSPPPPLSSSSLLNSVSVAPLPVPMEPTFRPRRASDGRAHKMDEIKKTCDNHEDLCRQFAECSLQLRQNAAQLEILNETASFLKTRHATIRRQIAAQSEDQNELKRLEEELGKVNNQVQMWMRELDEVNDCRTELEITFVRLRSALQKSVTSVQLASIDLDLLQNRHADRWKKFLADVQAEEAAAAKVAS